VSAEAVRLAVRGVEKSFDGVTVLSGVSLDVAPGALHALLGGNGAGKSTLMRVVLGLERADAGELRLDGAVYRPLGPADARARGVVMVPQERTLCLHLSVEENVTLGLAFGRFGLVRGRPRRELAARALAAAAGDAARIDLAARASTLSVADQQLVEIARALAHAGLTEDGEVRAKVLVLDEPTSSLGRGDAERLFERVAALTARGLAVVLVSHFLDEVLEHCERYTVLRDGRVEGEGAPREAGQQRIVREMLGELPERAARTARPTGDADEALRVVDLSGERAPRGASFVLRRGEILGVAGLVGSGRTELLRAIAGLDRRVSGSVVVSAPGGLGMLSEDRGGEGLMLSRSVADNVTLSPRGPFLVSPSRLIRDASGWMERLSVRAAGPTQRARELSGGNQQKVALARLLREDHGVLLVDEPTRGIDVGSKAQILDLLRELAAQGKAIVVVSSQLDELLDVADRVAVLRRGVLGAPRDVAEWDAHRLLEEAAA
jgi:ribose transport system ATP-binding protein